MSQTTRSRKSPAAWADRARDAFHDSGLTLHQIGVRMGYPDADAHRAAWHFLYRTTDPPLLEFCKFAQAVGVPIDTLVG